MGACISWCQQRWRQHKLTTPSIDSNAFKTAYFIQQHVLQFAYNILCAKLLAVEQTQSLSKDENHSAAAFRCINCGLFDCSRDFSILVDQNLKVQLQVPLCDECHLGALVPFRWYNPSQANFRALKQLHIMEDLFQLHKTFVDMYQAAPFNLEVMIVS